MCFSMKKSSFFQELDHNLAWGRFLAARARPCFLLEIILLRLPLYVVVFLKHLKSIFLLTDTFWVGKQHSWVTVNVFFLLFQH